MRYHLHGPQAGEMDEEHGGSTEDGVVNEHANPGFQKREPTYLVVTYSVRKFAESSASGSGHADRVMPKSQSCADHLGELRFHECNKWNVLNGFLFASFSFTGRVRLRAQNCRPNSPRSCDISPLLNALCSSFGSQNMTLVGRRSTYMLWLNSTAL